MKKFICIIMTVLMSFPGITSYAAMTEDEIIEHFNSVSENRVTVFTDINSFPWAVEPISELAGRGIVNGAGDGLFLPQNTVSRYEFIKMITGVCGIVNQNAAAPHNDLDETHWAYVYVASAYEAGMLDIYSQKIFNGAAPITREEIAYVSVAAMIKSGCIEKAEATMPDFTDTDKMSSYSPYSIATLASLGVINGRGDGSFCPKDYATRAESAKIVYNVLSIIENNF